MSVRYRHRLVASIEPAEEFVIDERFSFFDFLEAYGLNGLSTIHRCCSIARSAGVDRLLLEKLDPCGDGIVKEEYDWLKRRFQGYQCPRFLRLSFWRGADPLGIMLVRTDDPGDGIHKARTFVYEAVMPKYRHRHNCVHGETSHVYRVNDSECEFIGVLFAQQNGLSKCCAHVALYSLLEGNPDVKEEISFVRMTELAYGDRASSVNVGELGMLPEAIERILVYYGVTFHSVSFEGLDPEARDRLDYSAQVYAGSESGYGALMGFQYEENEKDQSKTIGHIIPVYGHTFNKDTWAPDATRRYFAPNSTFGYMPSRMWMSSFIAHDDNVGANLCIPRGFVRKESVQYVVEVLPHGAVNSAVQVEAQALQILATIMDTDSIADHLGLVRWFDRLRDAVESGDVILRTLPVKLVAYRKYLEETGEAFDQNLLAVLDSDDWYWLVEASVPQLFPANEEKVADLLFNLTKPIDPDSRTNFGFARVPGAWIYPTSGVDFDLRESKVMGTLPNFGSR